MKIVTELHAWRSLRTQLAGKKIGFVATMGNLHAGHVSLCDHSQHENELTVVSIFINPTQFNQSKDFDCYPKTLDQDIKLLSSKKVDFILTPTVQEIYHDHYQFQLNETELSLELEGAHRPGHFAGMLTVVMKLLNIVQPTRAYFGEKDYQQLLLVKKMVSAFFMPVEIIACATVRAASGLALSSRNSRLTSQQLEKAAVFACLLQSGKSDVEVTKHLLQLGFEVDYIAQKWQRRLGAVWLGGVRLIDNCAY